jgi:hypothetical protein
MSHWLTRNYEKSVGRASVPAGLPACGPHRQDAGASKDFSTQKVPIRPLPEKFEKNSGGAGVLTCAASGFLNHGTSCLINPSLSDY